MLSMMIQQKKKRRKQLEWLFFTVASLVIAGLLISAYSGAQGPIYSRIRKHQSIVLVGDRIRELAAIGAPVFGAHAEFVGALTLIMPSERMDEAYEEPVRQIAREITAALGGQYPAPAR